MPVPILLPDLGAADEQVRVSAWLADPGESVQAGERIVEVLISGVTFDVSAPATGRLASVEAPLSAVVSPGDVLGWIETENHP